MEQPSTMLVDTVFGIYKCFYHFVFHHRSDSEQSTQAKHSVGQAQRSRSSLSCEDLFQEVDQLLDGGDSDKNKAYNLLHSAFNQVYVLMPCRSFCQILDINFCMCEFLSGGLTRQILLRL